MARKLSDLYQVGKEVIFDDGGGEIVVWVNKLNASQHEQAFHAAQGKRAAYLTIRKADATDPDRLELIEEFNLAFADRESQMELAFSEEISHALQSAESKVEHEDDWAEESYLAGLKQAWETEMETRFQDNSEDAEARRVFLELQKFYNQVEKEYTTMKADIMAQPISDVELHSKAFDKFVESRADVKWLMEFREWEIYFATRDPIDHTKLYFDNRAEVKEIDQQVYGRLVTEYTNLGVSATEGKE